MANISAMKKLRPIRFFDEDFQKIQARMKEDKVNFQQLGHAFFMSYVNKHKGIMEIVQRVSSEKNDKKRRYNLTNEQAEDILSLIEKESPLKDYVVKQAVKEMKDGEKK